MNKYVNELPEENETPFTTKSERLYVEARCNETEGTIHSIIIFILNAVLPIDQRNLKATLVV